MKQCVQFRYQLVQRSPVLMESERFCRLRIRYIEQIRQCRKDGKTVAYTDETWVWCGMGHRRDWVIPENYRDPLSEAVPPPAPTSRGK